MFVVTCKNDCWVNQVQCKGVKMFVEVYNWVSFFFQMCHCVCQRCSKWSGNPKGNQIIYINASKDLIRYMKEMISRKQVVVRRCRQNHLGVMNHFHFYIVLQGGGGKAMNWKQESTRNFVITLKPKCKPTPRKDESTRNFIISANM